MTRPLTRRSLLRGGASLAALHGMRRVAGFGAGSALAWLDDAAIAAEHPSGAADRGLLVVVFLRGGADGLHLCAPLGDPHYGAHRGDLALSAGIAIPHVDARRDAADPRFHLHPAFAPVGPLVAHGGVAVVHMAGSPESSRSHFEAQDQIEMGLAGSRPIDVGWMTRALRPGASGEGPFSHLALTRSPPQSLRGAGTFTIDDPAGFGLPLASDRARRALREAYRDASDTAVGRAGVDALTALETFERALPEASGGRGGARRRRRRASVRTTLLDTAGDLEEMLGAGLPIRAAFLESDGWDSHRGQGAESGSVATRIDDLAQTLARLSTLRVSGTAPRVVVMSEFGRTVGRNGSRGTDHGHGGVMLVTGPGVRGGVHGGWSGLDRERLFEGRDLPVHSDYRDVLSEVLKSHLGTAPPSDTFPGHAATPLGLFA